MIIVKDNRVQIIWMLLACILLNAFFCASNHAAHLAFDLAMGQDAFCLTGDASPSGMGFTSEAHDWAEQTLDCPLCGSLLLGILALFALCWLPPSSKAPLLRARTAPRGPRHHWPALNPRAP